MRISNLPNVIPVFHFARKLAKENNQEDVEEAKSTMYERCMYVTDTDGYCTVRSANSETCADQSNSRHDNRIPRRSSFNSDQTLLVSVQSIVYKVRRK